MSRERNGFLRNRVIAHVILCCIGMLLVGASPEASRSGESEAKRVESNARKRSEAIENLIRSFETSFQVDNIDASKALKDDQSRLIFVDARTNAERLVSKIPGSISLSDFRSQGKAEIWGGKTIIIYCTIGYRSSQVAQRLAKESINAVNLRGGILSWIDAGGTLVDGSGQSTRRVHVYGPTWNILPPDYEAVH